MHEERNDDYEVGYGKPPKDHQWKPGQSGNPKGRPKKTTDFDKLLDLELSELVRIEEGGKTRAVPKRQLAMKALVNLALKGKPTALKLLLEYMRTHQLPDDFEPDPADFAALQKVIDRAKLRGTEAEENGDE